MAGGVAEGKAAVSGSGARSQGRGGEAKAPLQTHPGHSADSPVDHPVQVMERVQQPLLRTPIILQGHTSPQQLR